MTGVIGETGDSGIVVGPELDVVVSEDVVVGVVVVVVGVVVSKTEATGRNARPVASVATRTISEFTSLRQEMRAAADRVPAGV
jgi:hypothetical protein